MFPWPFILGRRCLVLEIGHVSLHHSTKLYHQVRPGLFKFPLETKVLVFGILMLPCPQKKLNGFPPFLKFPGFPYSSLCISFPKNWFSFQELFSLFFLVPVSFKSALVIVSCEKIELSYLKCPNCSVSCLWSGGTLNKKMVSLFWNCWLLSNVLLWIETLNHLAPIWTVPFPWMVSLEMSLFNCHCLIPIWSVSCWIAYLNCPCWIAYLNCPCWIAYLNCSWIVYLNCPWIVLELSLLNWLFELFFMCCNK